MTKAPAQLATSDQSNPAVKSNSADMAPSDLKEQFKKLLAQRKQLAQQRAQEQHLQEIECKYLKLLAGVQGFFTQLVQTGTIELERLDCPQLQKLLADGDFTANRAELFSPAELESLVDNEIHAVADAICDRCRD